MNTACLAAYENSFWFTWKGSEDLAALGRFVFLTHAGPHVGVHGVGAGDRFDGIVDHLHRRPRKLPRVLAPPR